MEYAECGDVYAEVLACQRNGKLPEEDWVWKVII